MNERTLRPGNIAAAALVIGGVLMMVVPHHALSILRLVVVTVAAAAGLHALAVNVPTTWWMSPFDRRKGPRGKVVGSDEVDWIRSTLAARRQLIARGPALPPGVLRVLQPLIHGALERQGLGLADGPREESARGVLSPLTWAVLTSTPLERAPWFRTVRPDGRGTARVVLAVLDDLDRLAGGSNAQGPIDTSHP